MAARKKKTARKKGAAKKKTGAKRGGALLKRIDKELSTLSKRIDKQLAPMRKEIEKAERQSALISSRSQRRRAREGKMEPQRDLAWEEVDEEPEWEDVEDEDAELDVGTPQIEVPEIPVRDDEIPWVPGLFGRDGAGGQLCCDPG